MDSVSGDDVDVAGSEAVEAESLPPPVLLLPLLLLLFVFSIGGSDVKDESLIGEIERAATHIGRLERGGVVGNEALVVAHVVGAREAALDRGLHSVAITLLVEDVGGDFVVQKADDVFDRVRFGGHDAGDGEQLGDDVQPSAPSLCLDWPTRRRRAIWRRVARSERSSGSLAMRVDAFQYNAIA
jgi:hypothetical protein